MEGSAFFFKTSASTDHFNIATGQASTTFGANTYTRIYEAGTWSDMRIGMGSNNFAATLDVTININGTNGNQSVTFPANTTTTQQDTTNTDDISAGDDVRLEVVNGADTNDYEFNAVDFVIDADTPGVITLASHGFAFVNDGDTRYHRLVGILSSNTTEANAQDIAVDDVTLSNLQVRVSSNSLSVSNSPVVRVGGVDGNQSVTISSSATGLFEDTSNTDVLSRGDLYCVKSSPASGSGTIGYTTFGCQHTYSSGGYAISAGVSSSAKSFSSDQYVPIATKIEDYSTEADAQWNCTVAMTVSNLHAHITTSSADAHFLSIRKNGTTLSNVQLAPGASVTGVISDITGTETFAAGDNINYYISGISSGSASYAAIGMFAIGEGTEFDMADFTYNSAKDLSFSANVALGMYVGDSGTRITLGDWNTTTNNIEQYVASTAYDPSSSGTASTYSETALPQIGGMTFKPDDTMAFVVDFNVDKVLVYNLSTPGDWNTATIDTAKELSISGTPVGIRFTSDGLTMAVLQYGAQIDRYDLGTAWDPSTGVLNSAKSGAISGSQTDSFDITEDGRQILYISRNIKTMYFAPLGKSWDFSTIGASTSNDTYANKSGEIQLVKGSSNYHIFLCNYQGKKVQVWDGPAVPSGGGPAAYDLVIDSGSLEISGSSVSLLHNPLLDVDAGAISISGQDVSLEYAASISADSGSLEISGQQASLLYNPLVSIGSGSVSVTGTDVDLVYLQDSSLDIGGGSITVTGSAAGLYYDATIGLQSGSLSITGTNAGLLFNAHIEAGSGSIGISGSELSLLYNPLLNADSGSVTITGTDVTLSYLQDQVLTADSGSIEITGQDVGFLMDFMFAPDSGSVQISGSSVTLTGPDDTPGGGGGKNLRLGLGLGLGF